MANGEDSGRVPPPAGQARVPLPAGLFYFPLLQDLPAPSAHGALV